MSNLPTGAVSVSVETVSARLTERIAQLIYENTVQGVALESAQQKIAELNGEIARRDAEAAQPKEGK